MASQDNGHDQFSDSDLDDLPRNALEELEHKALLHTQHQTQATQIIQVPPSSDYGDELEDEDLDDADVFDEAQGSSDRLLALQSVGVGLSTQREQFRKARYGGAGSVSPLVNRALRWNENVDGRPVQQEASAPIQQNDALGSQRTNLRREDIIDPLVEDLQKQVQKLLRERENLKQDLTIKAGEISIVRSKQEKAAKEYEREMTAIKKINAEKLAKQQEAIRAATEAERSAATELVFMKRDLLEEAGKVRSLERQKDKEKDAGGEPMTTPRKNKALAYRDGFDDDEIQVISPSKFQAKRSNPSTPTKTGTKRKRKGQDSPIISLEVEKHQTPPEQLSRAPVMIVDEALLERIRSPDDRLNFLELAIDHRPHNDHRRTFEEFTMLAFPSAPAVSFASIVIEKLPTLNAKHAPSDFPIEFCELIVSLWSQCLTEKYYKPVSLLVDLLTFCLELKTLTIAPFIMDKLVPVAQLTADLIAIPRFNRHSYAQFGGDIDVSACLAILHLVAEGCINNPAHMSRFWRTMRLDFVLMILSQHQLVEDFDMMLQLLTMSVMKESIGPIEPEAELQLPRAGYIIDRVSLLLINDPTVPEGSSKHDSAVIADLRIQILRTMEAFCQTTWGGAAVALHGNAIGRLVKLMSNELDILYDYRSGHQKSGRLVSRATRLLHHLTTKHEKIVNMQEKLSKIHGGSQKYLVCLARLNFMEDDLLFDADIGSEIQECAHEMLELAVTPEEGEAIHSAFSST